MVPNEWSATKIVLKRAGHALNSATQLAGDEGLSKSQREKRDKSKAERTRALMMSSQCLAPGGGWGVYLFYSVGTSVPLVRAQCPDRNEAGQAWVQRHLGSGSHALWGRGRVHIPGQRQQAFLEVIEQCQNSWTRQRLRKRNRVKGQATTGQNHSHWVSALRTEPGARMASESEPSRSSPFIFTTLLSSPSPFSRWGLRRSNAKDMDLESGDLAWVPMLLLPYMWCWTSLGFYKMGISINYSDLTISLRGSNKITKRGQQTLRDTRLLLVAIITVVNDYPACLELELVSDDGWVNALCALLQALNVWLINGATTGLAFWTLTIVT